MSQDGASTADPAELSPEFTPDGKKSSASDSEPTTRSWDADLAGVTDDDPVMSQADESLQRRLRDLDLRNELAACGFEGALWRRFAEELARYGLAVMHAWLASGKIFPLCARMNRPVGVAPRYWTDHDRCDLAHDTVIEGLRMFREKGLVGGGWTAEGGASFRTYFMGACVLVFPNIYRRWLKEHNDAVTRTDDLGDLGHTVSDDPATIVTNRAEARAALRAMPSREREAFVLREQGYTRMEIGELLAVADGKDIPYSEATVAGWLRSQRKRSRARREDGEHE